MYIVEKNIGVTFGRSIVTYESREKNFSLYFLGVCIVIKWEKEKKRGKKRERAKLERKKLKVKKKKEKETPVHRRTQALKKENLKDEYAADTARTHTSGQLWREHLAIGYIPNTRKYPHGIKYTQSVHRAQV